jgi:hypothetical protein
LQWLTPVIPVTPETEFGRISLDKKQPISCAATWEVVQANLSKNARLYLKNKELGA